HPLLCPARDNPSCGLSTTGLVTTRATASTARLVPSLEAPSSPSSLPVHGGDAPVFQPGKDVPARISVQIEPRVGARAQDRSRTLVVNRPEKGPAHRLSLARLRHLHH